ncbi:ParA family protein [Vibrio mexicanus]|uniref:ParA family protein n=1 Tax=Vibrio mexicanus TaxID=1004326 RepID=UPI00063C4342|nr:ParA family protein [Vibrio mexicanus]
MQYKLSTRNKNTVSIHHAKATKILVMNQKGGVGKSTVTAALVSHLIERDYKVNVIDFDKQRSSHDWADCINSGCSQTYSPSFRSLSEMALSLKVSRDAEFVILDSPSNFSREEMARYTHFVDAIILPMSPSPVDLHASLPFIKDVIDSGVLTRRNIALSFIINRCAEQNKNVERVTNLLNHFRQFPTLGSMSDSHLYQDAFYYKRPIDTSIDKALWQNTISWLSELKTPKQLSSVDMSSNT